MKGHGLILCYFPWTAQTYMAKYKLHEKLSHTFCAKHVLNVDQAFAGLGGSVGCAVRLETSRSRVQPPPRPATFFRGD